jgi:hypothetical protein
MMKAQWWSKLESLRLSCLACRPSQRKHYPPARRLVFHVLRGMPRLALTLDGLPSEAAAGELLRLQVRGLDNTAAEQCQCF